jgi:hypothetical protein
MLALLHSVDGSSLRMEVGSTVDGEAISGSGTGRQDGGVHLDLKDRKLRTELSHRTRQDTYLSASSVVEVISSDVRMIDVSDEGQQRSADLDPVAGVLMHSGDRTMRRTSSAPNDLEFGGLVGMVEGPAPLDGAWDLAGRPRLVSPSTNHLAWPGSNHRRSSCRA